MADAFIQSNVSKRKDIKLIYTTKVLNNSLGVLGFELLTFHSVALQLK